MDGFCDLHSHILPGMDDGCKTAQQSIEALRLSYAQGVRAMFATPHYYPVESVESFLARRQSAWEVQTIFFWSCRSGLGARKSCGRSVILTVSGA